MKAAKKQQWYDRLKEVMQELELTHEDLADLIGVSRGCVTNYLHGRRDPRLHHLCNIIEELELSADWLLFGE